MGDGSGLTSPNRGPFQVPASPQSVPRHTALSAGLRTPLGASLQFPPGVSQATSSRWPALPRAHSWSGFPTSTSATFPSVTPLVPSAPVAFGHNVFSPSPTIPAAGTPGQLQSVRSVSPYGTNVSALSLPTPVQIGQNARAYATNTLASGMPAPLQHVQSAQAYGANVLSTGMPVPLQPAQS